MQRPFFEPFLGLQNITPLQILRHISEAMVFNFSGSHQAIDLLIFFTIEIKAL
jgi:hypothetical protein